MSDFRGPIAIFAPAALIGAGVAGCGEAAQTGTQTSAEPPVKAAYTAQADAICERAQGKIDALEKQVDDLAPITSEDTSEVADLLWRGSQRLEGEVRQLQALHAPPADAGILRSMLSALSTLVVETRKLANAYATRDDRKIRRSQLRIARDAASVREIAESYGFKVCGRDSEPSTGGSTA